MSARTRFGRSVVAASILAATLLAHPALAQDQEPSGVVKILNAGGVTEEQLKDVEAYMARNVTIPFRAATAAPEGKDIASALAAAKAAREPGDGVTIVLASIEGSDDILVANPEKAWAIVNTAALAADSAEKTALRIKLVSMRALATALGAGYGVDPRCVNRRLAGTADIDKLGGNFSPPTLQSVLIGAAERGIPSIRMRKRQ